MSTIDCPNCNNTLSENETVCENCGWNSDESDAVKKPSPKIIKGEKLTSADLAAFNQGAAVLEFAAEKNEKKPEKVKTKEPKPEKHHRSIKDIKEDVRNFIKHGIDNKDEIDLPPNAAVFSFENLDTPERMSPFPPQETQSVGIVAAPSDFTPSADDFPDLSVFDQIEEQVKKEEKNRIGKAILINALSSALVKLCITILSIVVAFLLGFFVSNFYNSNKYVDRTYEMAANSVNAVLSKLPAGTDLYVHQIFIKSGTEKSECIIFAATSTSAGEYETTNYRLVIDMINPEETVLYHAFDPVRYEELKNGTPQEAVTASVMMSHYDSFKRSLNEILSGQNGWRESNAAYINLIISENRKKQQD